MFKQLTLLSIICATLTGCGGSDNATSTPIEPTPEPEPTPSGITFTDAGLSGERINHLVHFNDAIYAGTDTGLFKSNNDTFTQWQKVATTSAPISAMCANSTELFYATRPAQRSTLTKVSMNEELSHIEHRFAPSESEHIYALYCTESALYGTGNLVLSASYDDGVSWQALAGEYGYAATGMTASMHKSGNMLWYGGQGAIENPILRRVDLENLAQQEYHDLFPAPSTIKAIKTTSQEEIIISGEGGLMKSADQGETWTQIYRDEQVPYRFYFDFIYTENTHTLISAGWNKSQKRAPQPLYVDVSDNGGEQWQRFHYDKSADYHGGVLSLLPLSSDEQSVSLLLGLDMGGVVKAQYYYPSH